jgi:hypothetical protein
MTRSSIWITLRTLVAGVALTALLMPALQPATMTKAGADTVAYFSAVNSTRNEIWITLYVSGAGHSWWNSCVAWLKPNERKACYQQPTNGPYKFRAEVSQSGPHTPTVADVESGPFWKDGSQKQYRTPGNDNDSFYLCKISDKFEWRFQPCGR